MHRSSLSLLISLATLWALGTGCAHSSKTNPTPNEVLQSKEDLRFKLAQLTLALGEPLPPSDPKDRLGVESLPNLTQRVFAIQPLTFYNVEARIRLTAWKDRVHTLELSFPKGCDPACATLVMETMYEWLAAPPPQAQGNAQTQSVQMDTVLFTFEWYPKKTEVSRLIIRCQPLYAAAHHRPSRLPGIGQRIAIEKMPRCRPLMP
jgi:hypothetical protein